MSIIPQRSNAFKTAGGWAEKWVNFPGTAYLTRSSALTATDSKKALMFFATGGVVAGTGDRHLWNLRNSNIKYPYDEKLSITLRNATNNVIFETTGSTTFTAVKTHHLLSVDTDLTPALRYYIWTSASGWGQEMTANAASGGELIDFHFPLNGLCATSSGTSPYTGDVGRIMIIAGGWADITSSLVRDKFSNATTGALVDPATAIASYGTPLIHFEGDKTAWESGVNLGSGGNFTMTGTVTNV